MDSVSKEYYDSFKKEKREENQCQAIIKCSFPTSVTIPTIAMPQIGSNFQAGAITLNNSGLCNPCIKIEYSSDLVGAGFSGTVIFQVYKQCKNEYRQIAVGPSWKFSIPVPLTAATAFSFFVCDIDSCNDECCTYTVVVTALTITTGTLSINNALIEVIEVCNSRECS